MSRMPRVDCFTSHRRLHSRRRRRIGSYKHPFRRRLFCQPLEDRLVLTITVDTLVDENDGIGTGGISLRDAIGAATTGETIDFAAPLDGGTIMLDQMLGELAITDAVTIDASSLTNGLTIDAGDGTDTTPGTGDGIRIFNIDDGNGGNQIDVEIVALTLTGGDVSGVGGAIRSSEDLTVTSSRISGNATSGNNAYGGGITSYSGSLTVTGSTISGNSTTGNDSHGGGVYAAGNVTLTDSTVSGNHTVGVNAEGGGLFTLGALSLTNSTVSGNYTTGSSASGGGIRANAITLTSSTVTDNHANAGDADGGGIWNFTGAFVITNSIIAENTAGLGNPDLRPGTGTLTVNYSLIGDTSGTGITVGTGTGNVLNDDPDLAILANNGGPTQTHALLPGSPAIDMGDNASAMAVGLATDQRGFLRYADGDSNSSIIVDMGAVEINSTVVPTAHLVDTITDEIDFDFSTGDLALREAILLANGSVGTDMITFDSSLDGGTILLDQSLGELAITQAVTIDAMSLTSGLTIDAGDGTDMTPGTGDGIRIFNIDDGNGGSQIEVEIVALTLTGGDVSVVGGAIRSTENLTVTGSAITGNATSGDNFHGGGIYSRYGDLMVTGSTISGNFTSGNSARGGGIYSRDGNPTVTASTISGNSTSGSDAHGGGIYNLFGDLTVTGSTISGNSSDRGGGVYNKVGLTVIQQSTISGNGAVDGGGIWANDDLTLANSTVSANSAANGGGIWNGSSVFIEHSIIARNSAGFSNTDISLGPGTVSIDYTLIGDTSGTGITGATGTGNLLDVDPLLTPLGNYGGPTKTHALIRGSPAIDAGDAGIAPSPTEFDQRGDPFLRVVDDDGVGGPRIDIGAYESQFASVPALIVDTTTDEIDLDLGPGDLSLREAIAVANVNPGVDTVTFDALLDGSTILLNLGLGELSISDSATIDASSLSSGLTIDAGDGLDNTAGTGDGIRIFNMYDGGNRTIDVEIVALTLTGGDISGAGGAIISSDEFLTVISSTISGNASSGNNARGGAIYSIGAVLTVISSTISGNAASGNNAYGGGIRANALTLTNSTVSGNYTTGDNSEGGGISASTVTLTRSTVSGNYTTGVNAYGGGISAQSATLTQSTVSGNYTTGDGSLGGGISASTVTLTQSTVSGNHTMGVNAEGGGLFTFGALWLTNSTVSGNFTTGSSASGGGIRANGIALTSSTITDNHANAGDADGGGIWIFAGSFVSTGSIVAENTAGLANPDLRPGTGTPTVNYSLIGDTSGTGITGTTGTGNVLDVDPQLAPLANNGGSTQTHALLPGSPAIDMGDNASAMAVGLATDQRGFLRYADGDSNSSIIVDMGAVEINSTVVPTAHLVDTITDEIDFDFSTGDLALREAILLAEGSVGTDMITFDSSLDGGTILLDQALGELAITHAVTIDAMSLTIGLTIDAGDGMDTTPGTGDGMRIFNIDNNGPCSTVDVEIKGLTLTGGDVSGESGAAIRSRENLTVTGSTISGNSATFGGGGIHIDDAELTITTSTISGNSAGSGGGGIYGGSITYCSGVTKT